LELSNVLWGTPRGTRKRKINSMHRGRYEGYLVVMDLWNYLYE
jgi:hypothetical protein